MRRYLSLALVRLAGVCITAAERLYPTPRVATVLDEMGDDEIAAQRRDELLSAAFRSVIG